MARDFANNNEIRTSVNSANMTFGPGTWAAILREDADNGGAAFDTPFTANNSAGVTQWSIQRTSTEQLDLFTAAGGGSSQTSASFLTAAMGWVVIACTKAAGSAAPTFYRYRYDNDSFTSEATSAMVDGTAPGTGGTYRFGEWEDGDDFGGKMLVQALWDVVLTSDQIRNLAFNLAGWFAVQPKALWVFDQAQTTQNVMDMTGNGANQSLLQGTSVSTESAPIWNYGAGAVLVLIPAPAAGPQTISPTGIASLEAFGTLRANQQIRPTALGTAEAFGALLVNQQVRPSAIASAEAFGTHLVNQQIRPTGLATAEVFGTLLVNQQIRPGVIASLEAFGTLRVNQQIRPVGLATAEAFGSHTVTVAGGAQTIVPTGIASLEAFGTLRVNQQIVAATIASLEAFGSQRVNLKIVPTGIASLEAFGTARLNQRIQAAGITSAEAFGGTRLVLFIRPTGIASGETFGTAVVTLGLVTIRPGGIATLEAFGVPTVVVVGALVNEPGGIEIVIRPLSAVELVTRQTSGVELHGRSRS